MPVCLVLGPEARALGRMVGPTAWVVLEELLAIADQDDGRFVVTATVRSLAAGLAMGRDAVAAGLAQLRREGVVAFEAPRSGVGGRFGGGRYAVAVSVVAGLLVPLPDARASAPNPRGG